MPEPELWEFSAEDAAQAAHEVVHHTPDTPWERIPVPRDSDAAAASVVALSAEFQRLPPSIRGALGRASTNAAQLSDDRLQGLAELLQNADDVGADTAFFVVEDDRLMFGHNGSDLTLPDVWGLTIPWLSEKSYNAEALGRFGIGLKTLQSLSETLEAHNGHFHLSLGRSSLTTAGLDPEWPAQPDLATTIFVVPFHRAATTQDEVAQWLEVWGDAGLLFLRSLRSVSLLDRNGTAVARVRLIHGGAVQLNLDGGLATRTRVSADDGREWLRYTRSAASPESFRSGKAQTDTTPVAIAFPRFEGDEGHVHVGLPVRPIGLPFRFAGQFDPLANRRDISTSDWNLGVLELVAGLWVDAVLDLFATDASGAWAAVPLGSEIETDSRTVGPVRDALTRSLLEDARLAFADAVRLDGGHGRSQPLGDLAYETLDLTGVLSDDDIRLLAKTPGVLTPHTRSGGSRWRDVLDDLGELGATVPAIVDAADAVQLLDDPSKPISFLADLAAVVVVAATAEDEEDEDLAAELTTSSCIVLSNGTRVSPADASDLQVLLPDEASALWSTLGIGSHIHPEYRERAGWPAISGWLTAVNSLRRSATDEDALQTLAAAGREGRELPRPLTDEQADALRSALERIGETERPWLGGGIGMAIRLEATVYNADGSRVTTHARPADAYFIEKDRNSWSTAAKKTPGLVWLHRRYSEDLRAERGRAGIGAQKLFRLLGAESVPRLEPLPDTYGYYKHYVYYESGLWRDAPGSPDRRKAQMVAVGAQCTLKDLSSPDLDRVLADISKEKGATARRRRANALLGCLSRNWDRLESSARVTAANPGNGWLARGEVDAWWISKAALISWLSNGRGRPAAPGQLRLKTVTNEAMHGTDPTLYLADGYDQPPHLDVLTALGVEGNPTVTALLSRLSDIRTAHLAGRPLDPDAADAHPMTAREAADLAAPFYQALAAEVHGIGSQTRIGNMHASAARTHFDRGDGLISTNVGWRRTSTALAGDPIFGDLAAFVPPVYGAERLWAAIGVRHPRAEDAKRVLNLLSRERSLDTNQQQVMLEANRLLAQVPHDRIGQLRRQPVYVGHGWMSKRPVYAIANPLLADALAGRVPVWQPGGQLSLVSSLIVPLALTTLDASHVRVLNEGIAGYDANLTATFKAAVRNLQTDLTIGAPEVAKAIRLTWDEFAEFQIAVLPDLQIRVDAPPGPSYQAHLAAWLSASSQTLFVNTPHDTSKARSGGYAVASLFDSNPRDVAHAWVVAWSDAESGAQAEHVVSAAERAAEEKRRRADSQAALLNLPGGAGEKTGIGRGTSSKTGKMKPFEPPPGPTQTSTSHRARILVDIDDLVLNTSTVTVRPTPDARETGGRNDEPGNAVDSKGKRQLNDPNWSNPKKPGKPGRGPLNYTAEERETAGLELLRRVLGDETTLTDVRHQPNVGADAVDDKGRYYELKVHAGPIPNTVKLEDSQIQRALTTKDFYLALVGNMEDGQGDPEVWIIHDPIHHLRPEPQGAVHLTGVHSVQVAQSTTFSKPDQVDDE